MSHPSQSPSGVGIDVRSDVPEPQITELPDLHGHTNRVALIGLDKAVEVHSDRVGFTVYLVHEFAETGCDCELSPTGFCDPGAGTVYLTDPLHAAHKAGDMDAIDAILRPRLVS